MCRGKARDKAQILFDTIIGVEGVKNGKKDLAWRSSKMKAAFYRIIFFSEFMPRKYYDLFSNDLGQIDRYMRLKKIQKNDKGAAPKNGVSKDYFR